MGLKDHTELCISKMGEKGGTAKIWSNAICILRRFCSERQNLGGGNGNAKTSAPVLKSKVRV